MCRELKSASVLWVVEDEGVEVQSASSRFTKFGVSLFDLSVHRAVGVTVSELKELSQEEAQVVLGVRWDVLKLDQLPAGVDYVVFDSAVVCGNSTAINWLYLAYEQFCKRKVELSRREYLLGLRKGGDINRWLMHCDKKELRELLRCLLWLRRRRHRSESNWREAFQSKTNRCNRVERRAVAALPMWQLASASEA